MLFSEVKLGVKKLDERLEQEHEGYPCGVDGYSLDWNQTDVPRNEISAKVILENEIDAEGLRNVLESWEGCSEYTVCETTQNGQQWVQILEETPLENGGSVGGQVATFRETDEVLLSIGADSNEDKFRVFSRYLSEEYGGEERLESCEAPKFQWTTRDRLNYCRQRFRGWLNTR